MKSWDVVIIGGGIIGLSLALNLRRHGGKVLLLDRSEPGREASSAAGGMLAACDPHTPEAMRPLAAKSAKLWPEFVQEIGDESGVRVDYRTDGCILYLTGDEDEPFAEGSRRLDASDVAELEPNLSPPSAGAVLLPEASVDPRLAVSAAFKAARHRGVDISTGEEVIRIECSNLGVTGVATTKTRYPAATVVNCAGAWSGQIDGPPGRLPTRPVKGHMLDVIPSAKFAARPSGERPRANPEPLLTHVVRAPFAYLVPRSNGRVVIGSTVESAGFDKRVVPELVQELRQRAANLCPPLGDARMHESWTGLRPGTPDGLPMIGATTLPGYHVATGHFRDGILLAPATAAALGDVIRGTVPDCDLAPFSPERFSHDAEKC